jgi:hypothetical protein
MNARRYKLTAAILLALLPNCLAGQIPESELERILDTRNWTVDEREALRRGEPVVRSLPTWDKRESAMIGALRMPGLPAVPMQAFRESLSQKGSETVHVGGRLGTPPTVADLQDLRLDKRTVEALRKCVPGRCDINLPASMITQLRAALDADPEAGDESANVLFREMLVRLVDSYAARGDSALGTYDNWRSPIDLAASHRSLLAGSRIINEISPELAAFISRSPASQLTGAESSFHWSIVDFGLKPVITVSHLVAYTNDAERAQALALVTKQIYSSRYLDSSLTATFLVRVEESDGISTYILFSDRSRAETLAGRLGGLVRGLAHKQAKERIESLLRQTGLRLIEKTRPREPDTPKTSGTTFYERLSAAFSSELALAFAVALMVMAVLLTIRRRRSV